MSLYANMGPPMVLGPWTIPKNAAPGFGDPLLVTAAEIRYRKPNGTEGAWVASVTSTADASTVSYALNSGDLNAIGVWSVYVALTVPGGVIRTNAVSLRVLSPFAFSL